MTNKKTVVGLFCATLAVAGCMDLDSVEYHTAPTAEQVLSDPEELQLVIAGTFNVLWNYSDQSTSVAYGIPGAGNEWVSGNSTLRHYAMEEPRSAYPNDYSLDNRFVSQNPWYGIYEGIADLNDALKLIEQDGVRLMLMDEGEDEPTDKTDRARAFAYLMQGALYSILALGWDQATIRLPDTDMTKSDWWHYKPYEEVAAVAIGQLEKAIQIAESADPFVTPETWMSGVSIDNEGVIRLAHTFIARTMAYLPRTPEQRKDVSEGGIVDWDKVIYHADRGITEDFKPVLSSTGLYSNFVRYQSNPYIMVADPRLYGPADVSGEYAKWMAADYEDRDRFLVTTYDRRITGVDENGDPDPTAPGKYFRYTPDCCAADWKGYMRGYYIWYRYNSDFMGLYYDGPKTMLSVTELNLLKAEAHYRKGRVAEAVDLINITRVGNGELPPLEVTGVPGDLNTCVPRTFDGTACGTVLDALHHERMIELAGLNMWRTWWDRRGFGTLSKGTYTQLPVPVRELQALGQPFYTTGGDAGSAADGIPQVR